MIRHYLQTSWWRRYAWMRRWTGGHWERWTMRIPAFTQQWFAVRSCHGPGGTKPDPDCIGTPTCEDYGEEGAWA